MRNFALIGHPLGHSMSPMIHKKLFDLSGRTDSNYGLADIPAGKLADSIDYLHSLKGFNVTIPYKTDVIELLDGLAESTERYNAVNCVMNDNGRLIGYNTDCDGFLSSAEKLPISGKVLLLGCGGAGRMMAVEAAMHGAELTIAVRPSSRVRAQLLMAEIMTKCSGVSVKITEIDKIGGCYDLLLNSTPVGMYPDIMSCPVSDSVIENCTAFFDAVYNPTETQLIKKARAMGKTAVGGAAMLVNQAVKAHEIWDGDLYGSEEIDSIVNDVEKKISTDFT